MQQPLTAEFTTFTLDTMGRFLANTLQEALDSSSQTIGSTRRDFDVIVVGGGSFGSIVAERLLLNDTTHGRRILVLEAGPFVLPEHWQNLPFMGGAPDMRRPWVADTPQSLANGRKPLNYPGLMYAAGGRSLAWGGWSPQLRDAVLKDWLGLAPSDTTAHRDLVNMFKLEAPLAVQSQTLPGLFPFNKFSAIPLLIRAARIAETETDGVGVEPDARKRLMVVTSCHVLDLVTETQPDNW